MNEPLDELIYLYTLIPCLFPASTAGGTESKDRKSMPFYRKISLLRQRRKLVGGKTHLHVHHPMAASTG